MKNKTGIFGSIAAVLTLAAGSASASMASPLISKTVEGEQAKELMDALLDAGVTDNRGLLGAMKLKADKIDCRAPVVWHPTAKCTVEVDEESLQVEQAHANAMYRVLVDQGAVVPSRMVGSTHAVALDVVCTRPVVANPQSTCTFNVYTQQP